MRLFFIVVFMLITKITNAQSLPEIESKSQHRQDLEVTIYNGNLAQIFDQRSIELTNGLSRLYLEEVSGKIIPQTAKINAGDMVIQEMNFDFDLMDSASLLRKSVGKNVRVFRPHPTEPRDISEIATVLSAHSETILQFQDRIEVFNGQFPGRIVFDEIPDNLRAKPTLSSIVDMKENYQGLLDLTYLTRGLSWFTDYVGYYDEENQTLDLVAWVTLNNTTNIDYLDTSLKLVAGEPNDVYDQIIEQRGFSEVEEVVVTGFRSRATREDLAEYHLYTLPFKVDILNRQIKQVELFDSDNVVVQKFFRAFDTNGVYSIRQPLDWGIRFKNDQTSGLNLPMPEGRMGIYKKDSSGRGQFIGSDYFENLPINQNAEIRLGQAFDVTFEGKVHKRTPLGKELTEYEGIVTFSNAKNHSIEIEYELNLYGNSQIIKESINSQKIGSGHYLWKVQIPPRSETILDLTYQIGR